MDTRTTPKVAPKVVLVLFCRERGTPPGAAVALAPRHVVVAGFIERWEGRRAARDTWRIIPRCVPGAAVPVVAVVVLSVA